jgi:hypothetical protein
VIDSEPVFRAEHEHNGDNDGGGNGGNGGNGGGGDSGNGGEGGAGNGGDSDGDGWGHTVIRESPAGPERVPDPRPVEP